MAMKRCIRLCTRAVAGSRRAMRTIPARAVVRLTHLIDTGRRASGDARTRRVKQYVPLLKRAPVRLTAALECHSTRPTPNNETRTEKQKER